MSLSTEHSAIERIEALEAQVAILTDLTCRLQTQCKILNHFVERILADDTPTTADTSEPSA